MFQPVPTGMNPTKTVNPPVFHLGIVTLLKKHYKKTKQTTQNLRLWRPNPVPEKTVL